MILVCRRHRCHYYYSHHLWNVVVFGSSFSISQSVAPLLEAPLLFGLVPPRVGSQLLLGLAGQGVGPATRLRLSRRRRLVVFPHGCRRHHPTLPPHRHWKTTMTTNHHPRPHE